MPRSLGASHCDRRRRQGQAAAEKLFLAHEFAGTPTPRIRRKLWLHQAEQTLTARIVARLPVDVAGRLRALVAPEVPDDDTGGDSMLALITSVPGNVSLDSMLTEIRKLRAARAMGLPSGLFADVAPRVVAGWRARASVESPSHLRDHPEPLMLTLLAALLHTRLREITDTLVELLISTVHRIGARADKRVTEELVNAFKRVTGKENLLFAIAETALDRPNDVVREVAYPAVVRWRAEPAGAGARVQDQGPGVPAHCTDHAEGVLFQPLPARADRTAGRARVPVEQSHPPAGARGPGPDQTARRRPAHLLPGRGDRAHPQGRARRLGHPRVQGRWQGRPAGGAFDQNIFTEWHSRYGGRGVLIYWHVERKSMAIHFQLINCSGSEVAAMVEGAMRHGTTMEVEGNYVDSHGQSEVGFGITRLLGFDLLPRIKRINKVRLYRPAAGESDRYPRLRPALSRPIRWDIIAEQYDQMIKYATAIRSGTASTEAILRRFTRSNAIHSRIRR